MPLGVSGSYSSHMWCAQPCFRQLWGRPWKMAAHNFDGVSNMLSIVPVVTGHTVIPPGVVGGAPVLLPQTCEYSSSSFKVLCTCFSKSGVMLLHFMVLLGIEVALTIFSFYYWWLSFQRAWCWLSVWHCGLDHSLQTCWFLVSISFLADSMF